MKKALLLFSFVWTVLAGAVETVEIRTLLEDLALERIDDQEATLQELADSGDEYVTAFVDAWRVGEIREYQQAGTELFLVQEVSGKYIRVSTGETIDISSEVYESLDKNRAPRKLRRLLTRVTDTIGLASKNVNTRVEAALKLGASQRAEYLPELQRRFENEKNAKAKRAFEEAIMISLLANAETSEELIGAVIRLGELHSIRAKDKILAIVASAGESGDEALQVAAQKASDMISDHEELLKHAGSFFRGLSTGSVLLMVSFGLAITFGLMGIINMAHGEFIAIGGYTCYVVQGYFSNWFGESSPAFQWFFWVSLPVSFAVAGGIGFVLEKGFFRFLYKRPLESLLATWGLSMVMRQAFRLKFGAANVQVANPDLLLGNFEYAGISMSYARLFAIAFAGFVCVLTWLLLTKTNLGLYIRAVMQNRNMASSLGIPVKRVNSMTFAFGCGLAAMAGAVLTQIGNVGPTMGQAYIVDSFMVVVVGGVGNLLGAGISAMGIGVFDQFLQPLFGPVMGKIIVLGMIILFLQWKPGGIFPTKSRSMDD
ncbi:amino acid or sugar ABC transport system, permease protein [Verrucomicrobiia bacterium DG1235]|nr:amino acid or sugar ABC transport system, permease protein [Verrucomicrobiae bacterium DG1235]